MLLKLGTSLPLKFGLSWNGVEQRSMRTKSLGSQQVLSSSKTESKRVGTDEQKQPPLPVVLDTPLSIHGRPFFSPTSLGLQEKPEERLTPNTAANISEEGLRRAKGSEDREVCHKKTSSGHDMDSGRMNSTAAVATIQDLHNTAPLSFHLKRSS